MALTSGTRLGTYEIVAPLGAGGMGEVYRARDLRLRRELALKVLPETLARDAEHLARFEREARTLAGLNHPNIVTLFSVEDVDDTRFLTMELIEGQSLADLVTLGGLPVERVLDLGASIADALAAAHERHVVHRDLKPANVMVTRDGRVKVLDFGLAKRAAASATALTMTRDALSEPGMVAGTVSYMAPEQIRAEKVDARTDLFAFGIVLYELLSGRRPFTGSNAIVVSMAILSESPEPLARLRSDLPHQLARIVGWCLEKNPLERPRSALDVANELRGLRRSLEHGGVGQRDRDQVASIAVLPFVNRSRDEEDEYFSDGLADELLNVLAKVRGLRVAARTSAFHFKGKDTTIAEVGSALHVATVLEGSVRRAGNRVRISVQLVKVSDGYQMWSEIYDRTLDDIFAVQEDIAQSLVKELRAALLGEEAGSDASGAARAEVSRAMKGRGTHPEAHRLYLRARHLLDLGTREAETKAIEYLQQALDLDPTYALAWAVLGKAYTREADRGWAPVADAYEWAREAVERALTLEPDLAEAHAEKGWIRESHDWDWRGAQASYARALALAPGSAEVLAGAGLLARSLGRLEDALSLCRRALELDPLSVAVSINLGLVCHAADRWEEAEAAYRRALELAPQRAAGHAILSLTLLAQGRSDEALAEAMLEPHDLFRLWALAIVHHTAGRELESESSLHEMTERHAATAAFQIAEVHGARGEKDAAFDWLERAYAQRDPGLGGILVTSPRLRSLHGDSRWAEFLKKMGFDD